MRLCDKCGQLVVKGGVRIKQEDGTFKNYHGNCFNIVNRKENKRREGRIELADVSGRPQHPTLIERVSK